MTPYPWLPFPPLPHPQYVTHHFTIELGEYSCDAARCLTWFRLASGGHSCR
jgi:hypothetical protein